MLTHYQRKLPHILPPGETIFLTFRLADSLPVSVIIQLRATYSIKPTNEDLEAAYRRKKRYFGAFDELLDRSSVGPHWLQEAAVANVVAEALHYRHQRDFTLWAYCLMSNHVHLVVTIPEVQTAAFSQVMQSLKARTAQKCNKLLQRIGQPFWQAESYDHVVRDAAEMARIISYTLENPVKAGLIEHWQQWPHSYLNPDF